MSAIIHTFRVTWTGGKKLEVDKSDCETVEQFCNAYFGSADWEGSGVTVALVAIDGQAPPADPQPTQQADPQAAAATPAVPATAPVAQSTKADSAKDDGKAA